MTTKRAIIFTAVSSQVQATEDKVSLEDQEQLCRQWCASNGYTVIKHLTVPGFSRSEEDPIKLLEDLAAEGVYAYHELRALWQQRGFDVLVAYHHSRLARSQTVYSWVVNNVTQSGADIYLIDSGWIRGDEAQMQVALGGFAAANEIKGLVKKRHAGMRKRVEGGLHPSKPPFSHKVLRDERGKAVKLVVNPDTQAMIRDAAQMLLDGVGWTYFEDELLKRYGHTWTPAVGNYRRKPNVTPYSEPFPRNVFFNLFYNPYFWGNSAYRWHDKNGHQKKRGLWAFDPTEPAPEGVIIHYGTHEPAITGELALRVMAEIRRRKEVVKGRARPHGTSIFSGIFVCAECGRRFVLGYGGYGAKRWPIYHCASQEKHKYKTHCTNKRNMRVESAKAQLTPFLVMIAEGQTDGIFQGEGAALTGHIEQLVRERETALNEIRRLIRLQAQSDELADLYQDEISAKQQHLATLNRQIEEAERQRSRYTVNPEQQVMIEFMKHLENVEDLWKYPEQRINQVLHALFRGWRWKVLNAEIISLVPAD